MNMDAAILPNVVRHRQCNEEAGRNLTLGQKVGGGYDRSV